MPGDTPVLLSSCVCGVLQQNRRVWGLRNKIDELGSAQQKSGTSGNERILQQKIIICPEKSILSGKITVPAAPCSNDLIPMVLWQYVEPTYLRSRGRWRMVRYFVGIPLTFISLSLVVVPKNGFDSHLTTIGLP